ncbi:DUF885 domain-containing protein [Sphingomonas sp. IC4-52]|uniref:DUF885 domain-containing protein n=1 Tax=Sphingomonas sp. IC4-52 TaxID=2887202 RepID=UPI001D10F0E6|nr:DUF885 family protein [Sphingomonas sp. IC4-52]MCC2981005.1 DUF885 family protein [Sphingomonas sp. IC4-52]
MTKLTFLWQEGAAGAGGRAGIANGQGDQNLLSRRQIIAAMGAVPALAAASRALAAPPTPITEVLEQFIQKAMRNSPQLLTLMGADSGPFAKARTQLDDRSPAGVDQMRTLLSELSTALDAYDPKQLSASDWVNHQSAKYLAATNLDSFGFPFGDPNVGIAVPYTVSQLTGSYQSIPSFLATQHRIASADDADAYLSRLSAFAVVLDQETERSRADYARGAIPPAFVLRRTLAQLDALLAPAPEASELVTSLVERTAAEKIAGDWRVRAAAVMTGEVKPALLRQRGLLADALPRAGDDAGVWRLPRGGEYYRYAIRAATTTDMAPEEIHRFGLERVAELTGRADAILKAQGITGGTVAARLARLRRDPRHLYPNDDAGRTALIADLNKRIDQIKPRLPDYFGHLPRAGVEIRRTPASVEAGAPGGTYQPPSLDGSRPGLFSINLRDLAEWPRFDLPTLVYHEAIPGHHLQNASMIEAPDVPTLRRLPLFSGYSEGWGLYAEQLAQEMGVYADDPLGEVGYLASMLFRAARLVVDSGLHHMRWTRERAIRYMVDTLGDAESTVTREVERYCVQPGQASSYMLGWRVWTSARDRAQARLGDRFDIREFHNRGLLAGSIPLDVLARVIDDWR